MSFSRRRFGRDRLESDLRRHRPQPREEFVRELEARISAELPRRRGARARVGLVGVLTAALLVAAAVFGGFGYAASSVGHAAHAVAVTFKFSPHTVGSVSAAADQYGKVTLCHNGHEISISQHAVAVHLAHGDTLGPCPSFAATVHGKKGDDTRNLSTSTVNANVVDLSGDNTIRTNNRDNRVTTGAGKDSIVTGSGSNRVSAGAGNDTIDSHGKDTIFAGAGNDTIDVRNGKADFVNCGGGRDTVIADGANLDYVADDCEVVRRAPSTK